MTTDELRRQVALRIASLPVQAQNRQRAIEALLRGRAAVGGPPKGIGV